MQPKTKKAVLVIGSFLVLGAIGGFLLWKRKKAKEKEKAIALLKTELPKVDQNQTNTSTTPEVIVNTPLPVVTAGDGMPSSPSDVMKFQDWLDKKGLKWVGAKNSALTDGRALLKGSGYGNFGASTQKAWAVYGAEYLKLTTPAKSNNFKNGDNLYPKGSSDNAFNYPAVDKKFVIGKIVMDGAKPVAKFIGNTSKTGWIKAKAIVTDYTWNDETSSYGKALKDVYLQSKNYTNVAP